MLLGSRRADSTLATLESEVSSPSYSVRYSRANLPLYTTDRINMAYTSSTVTKGRAKGIVVAIGMKTEIGSIAESLRGGDTRVRKVGRNGGDPMKRPDPPLLLQVRKNEDGSAPWHRYVASWGLTVTDFIGSFLGTNVGTPLQRTLSWLAIGLFGIAGIFALFCFAANDFQTDKEIILYAIATGLAMIPASLVVSDFSKLQNWEADVSSRTGRPHHHPRRRNSRHGQA